MILQQIFTSPYASGDLQRFIDQASVHDALLLLQDGVYALHHPLLKDLLDQQKTIYMLDVDLIARGLHCDIKQLNIINDQQWLTLCIECDNVISWT
ncbi:sulfurtransferase complex subunit TusB [Paraglaciecola sp.]|uniref:sulfurtransferase complex subunit TusB n=1 Tax=Paraglaciecola sp. TaxID=1920173 RepID=UPI0030F3B153